MGYGFFDINEVYDPAAKKNGPPRGCASCGLYKGCLSPKMPETGKGKKKVFFIAEASGEQEDRKNKQLVGKIGQYLRRVLKELDFNLDVDGVKINSCSCRPPDNATPTDFQIACCRPRVLKALKKAKPKVVVLLGGTALTSYFGHRSPEALGGILKWQGANIPDRENNCWIVPTFHPSYVERDNTGVAEILFKEDLEKALSLTKTPLPYMDKKDKDCVTILSKPNEVAQKLEYIHRMYGFVSIDWETTGLKPYAKGHELYSCGIAVSEYESYSFLISKQIKPILRRVLKEDWLYKTAHNLKFENMWAKEKLGTWINGWLIDTMLSTHRLDNRKGVCGLKHQVAVNFGVLDYDSHIKKYLQAKDPKNANSLNTIKEAPVEEVLLYGGLDALYGYRLAVKHLKELEKANVLNNG